MCGIAGILHFNHEKADPGLLEKMIQVVRHRGPDGLGIYTDRAAGLAHTRLSIIDLSGGHQPMSNQDQSLWITFNGEIFNYIELREELQQKGHRFATQSDTEVILHLYEEMGEECVQRFNGQWAFAIWDRRDDKLFLSRDRLGVRPLFYTITDQAFVFGSEIKSIFVNPQIPREVDPIALDQIFTFWSTIPPRTIFQGIQELPPGHSLVVADGKAVIQPYWQINYPPAETLSAGENIVDEQKLADRLLELLIDSVRIRLRSDVPVGAYLSGGLDSTIITALIKGFTKTPLHTFSVTFDDPEFDESAYQKEAVAFIGTDHQEVRCSYQDIGRIFPEVIWHTERPILRTAPAPLYLLSKLVRDSGYKVVLTGEGSDEIFGGYDIFKEAKIRKFWGSYPDSNVRPLLLKRLYPYLQNLQQQSDAYRKAFFHVKPEDLASPFFSHLPRWQMTSGIKTFFSDEVKSIVQSYDGYQDLEGLLPGNYRIWDSFSRSQYLETLYLLPGYILSSQGDRVTMAHSVEGRFPFLDYRVVEFASTISPRLKMKVLNEKYILKRCAGHLIPPSVKKRPKQPYRAPEGKSFFNGSTTGMRNDYVHDLLSPDRIQKDGLFHPAIVRKLAEKAKRGQAIGIKDNMAIVGILSTQLVVDQFINHFSKRAL